AGDGLPRFVGAATRQIEDVFIRARDRGDFDQLAFRWAKPQQISDPTAFRPPVAQRLRLDDRLPLIKRAVAKGLGPRHPGDIVGGGWNSRHVLLLKWGKPKIFGRDVV